MELWTSVPPGWPNRGQSKTRKVFEIYPGLAHAGTTPVNCYFYPGIFIFIYIFCTGELRLPFLEVTNYF